METSFLISEFLKLSASEFSSRITTAFFEKHGSLEAKQDKAWKNEFDHLKRVLSGLDGKIIFEYNIPGLPKTIDVVLLLQGLVFVLEYKTSEKKYKTADINQTVGYALRLKYYHSNSRDRKIIPILVATDAETLNNQISETKEDGVYKCIKCNSRNLTHYIKKTIQKIGFSDETSWYTKWEDGRYLPSPTIIDAVRDIWCKQNVRDFKTYKADEQSRLAAEEYIKQVVSNSFNVKKSICFVTGVPGAGKTLVGLNLSVELQ